jgi:hypothetical protein
MKEEVKEGSQTKTSADFSSLLRKRKKIRAKNLESDPKDYNYPQ